MSRSSNGPHPRRAFGESADDRGKGTEGASRHESPNRPVKPPKRVRFGLKLSSKDEPIGRNDVATQWLNTLNAMVDGDGRQEGIEYARQGQTINMDIKPGVITADVQGRRGRPYTVTITFDTLSESQWSRLINIMASEAAHVAKLLAGELPEQLTDMLHMLRIARAPVEDERSNAPAILGRPEVSCTCGYHRPCKHAAAIGYLLVERFNDEPSHALTLLGMAEEQVKDQLRQVRVMKTQGVASAHPDQFTAVTSEHPPPLEACIDEFWRYGPQLSELEQTPLPHHLPHALLRRLGPSPLKGRFPMVGLLASVYDTVTKAAIDLRDRAEQGEGE